MRIIPKTVKVKLQFFKNVTIADTILGLVGLVFLLLLFLTNIGIYKYFFMVIVLAVFICLYLPFDGQRTYLFFINLAKYIFSVKTYSMEYKNAKASIESYVPFTAIKDGCIVYSDYYAKVLEVDPREFKLLSEFRQDQIIDANFGKTIRAIAGKTKASIVKIDRKLVFSEYLKNEEAKRQDLYKTFEAGSITKEELVSREKVIDDRIRIYNRLDEETPVEKPFYYLVVYDADVSVINEIMNEAITNFQEAGMTSRVLDDRGLALFLKYQYSSNFDEKDVDIYKDYEIMNWIIPHEVHFTPTKTIVDGEESYIYTVRNFPIAVLNAWGYQIFNIPNTKVIMNLEPYEKQKAVRMIDRSLQELASQSDQSYKASSMLDKQTHIQTLVNVLRMLQNDNETLFKVTLHFVIYKRGNVNETRANIRKNIRRILTEQGFELVDNYCRQSQAMISSQISRYDCMSELSRAIQSGSVAAVFPFVLTSIMEPKGAIIGTENGYPVVVDFFTRNNERVNSNMVILGKSGSGKSYATKTLLTHLSAENSKIFILDPENEYQFLAENIGGRIIDVGTASQGRINPFHIITTLESDEDDLTETNDFYVHLQFLEQFFRVILVGIDPNALEYLNNVIVELYKSKDITPKTDLSTLKPEDFPIFEDLNDLIERKYEEASENYDKENLRTLKNFISKFAHDGRNSNLWNGPSTLTVKENFTVFNFRSLLSNQNGVIANAQMLLVLKWLDNEISKNRDFNIKHSTNRKIIVAIDEAHVFIDPKYPIALDFMYQLAKRIRKYNGMQIVITQNIKDFVGSEDIVRKSSAIINACQYSFIFALAPNDMDDLCTLYDKAGQINETEQDQIVNNDRGSAFIITGPMSRTNISIVASKEVKTLFGEGI